MPSEPDKASESLASRKKSWRKGPYYEALLGLVIVGMFIFYWSGADQVFAGLIKIRYER
jgi:hypothetical protein